jgi:serine/threonine protein kinase
MTRAASLGELTVHAGLVPAEELDLLCQALRLRVQEGQGLSLARLLLKGGLSRRDLRSVFALGAELPAIRCDGCGAEVPQQMLPDKKEYPCSKCGVLLLGFAACAGRKPEEVAKAASVRTQTFQGILPLPGAEPASVQAAFDPKVSSEYVYMVSGEAPRSDMETFELLRGLLDEVGSDGVTSSQRGKRRKQKKGELPHGQVGGFRLQKPLGEGAMGVVFLAERITDGRKVALKLLHPDRSLGTTALQRFQQEAEALARVQGPTVVEVVASGFDEQARAHYLALEFLEGGSLADVLKRSTVLAERTALEIVLGVCLALEAAMDHGLIHRDVKPGNILLSRDGKPKLADLGLAKDLDSGVQITATGLVMGTPAYLSPEQALGVKELDIRSDLYSLGCCLYEMLTGKVPFVGERTNLVEVVRKRLESELPDPRLARPEVSFSTVEILRGLTARDRDDRYPFPSLVARDVERVLAGGDVLGAEDLRLGEEEPPLDRSRKTAPPPPQSDLETRALPAFSSGVGPATTTGSSAPVVALAVVAAVLLLLAVTLVAVVIVRG